MTEEFTTLSEKRKELFELHKNVIPSAFMLLIEEQDREAVRLLNEEVEEWYQELSIQYIGKRNWIFEADRSSIDKLKNRLNKIFGKELTNE